MDLCWDLLLTNPFSGSFGVSCPLANLTHFPDFLRLGSACFFFLHRTQSFISSPGFYCACAYIPLSHLCFFCTDTEQKDLPLIVYSSPQSHAAWVDRSAPPKRLESWSFLPMHVVAQGCGWWNQNESEFIVLKNQRMKLWKKQLVELKFTESMKPLIHLN